MSDKSTSAAFSMARFGNDFAAAHAGRHDALNAGLRYTHGYLGALGFGSNTTPALTTQSALGWISK